MPRCARCGLRHAVFPPACADARPVKARPIPAAPGVPGCAVEGTLGGPVRVRVAIHADLARLREGPDGVEVLGGPVCDTNRWAPSGEGFLATPRASAGLDAGPPGG